MSNSEGVALDWKRDSKGYRIVPAEPSQSGSLAVATGTPERIVRVGGRLEAIRPIAENGHLFLKFAQLRTQRDALEFINRFGPLTTFANEPGGHEVVADVLKWAGQMRDMIEARVEKRLADLLESRKGFESLKLDARLVPDRLSGAIMLQIEAPHLLSALRFQLASDLTGDSLRVCLECRAPFRVGPGARRADAKFCSDQHREAFKSRNRSQKGSQA